MTSAAAPPPRKFPPPCWSDEEAQALISVFKQKWTSLNRANLKSHDWDDVAASLAALFPHISPSKTAVQCHNKVEKLRKRFRSEKLRASARPGRSSPWALYPFLQDLDTSAGPTVAEINHNSTAAAHFPVKSLGHRHMEAPHAPWFEEASYSKRRRSAVKEDDDEEEEVVAAIRRLGEKYMEVEKRKMETAREIVMMQMDMEMKQTKAVMESQQQMLAACVAALLSDSGDNKKKKKKRTSNAATATEGDESS